MNLAWLGWYKDFFEKSGIKIISHKFYKNQQVIKFIDQKGRTITKQIFNPDAWGSQKIIVRCKEGLPLNEVF